MKRPTVSLLKPQGKHYTDRLFYYIHVHPAHGTKKANVHTLNKTIKKKKIKVLNEDTTTLRSKYLQKHCQNSCTDSLQTSE